MNQIVANRPDLCRPLLPQEGLGWDVWGKDISSDFDGIGLRVWLEPDRYLGIVMKGDAGPHVEINLDEDRNTRSALADVDGDIQLLHTGVFSGKFPGGPLRPVWNDTIEIDKKTWFRISSVNNPEFFQNVIRYYLSRRPNGEETDDDIEDKIKNDPTISATEKKVLISARRGQGQYRDSLMKIETCCRVTGVSDPRLLRASHIKPWRKCQTHQEKLDGYNGLLLAPHIDHLFDQGYISFEDEGSMLVSSKIDPEQLRLLGLPMSRPLNVGSFDARHRPYLDFHRTLFGFSPAADV